MKKCAFVVVRKRTGIGRSVRVIRGNSMDVIFHLTRCPLGKESVGKHAVVGETDEKAKFVRHSKQEDRWARTESVSSVSHIGQSGKSSGGRCLAQRTVRHDMHDFWRRVTRWNDSYFQSEGVLFGIHILVHTTRKVNEQGRKSLGESQLQERTNRVKRT
jgi:hypothetical protein